MSEEITFGEWLRRRRSELGVTQEGFSDRLGFSFAMLRKLESGERRPSGQIAHLLAGFFSVPDDEREAFVAFARTGRAAASGVAPHAPWRNAHRRQTNLPATITGLIGRQQEVIALQSRLLHPKTRLLTLTGPPGIGKTRLALQVAHRMVEQVEDGVFFIDLSPLIDPDAVLLAIAKSLGLKEESDTPILETLCSYLREKRMLLLLDNFEQVLGAAHDLVKLMEGAPWLRLLVTTREALHVRGEKRFPLSPLALPDLEPLPPLSHLATYSSVELFVERAQETAPDFALTAENAPDIAVICVGLEGLPLAIELAAAHTRHFSPAEIRAGLGNRLKLLTGGAQDLPARQRTLLNAIEWSYNLLSPDEKGLFRRLGVFVGGCTIEAIDVICGANIKSGKMLGQGSLLSAQAQELLLTLVDKNLIRRDRWDNQASQSRFGMLEGIREYARAKLGEAPEEAYETQMKHAKYYMALAEEAEHQLTEGQVVWLDRLEKEYGNLLAALDWAGEYGNKVERDNSKELSDEAVDAVEIGLRIAGALFRFWHVRGYWNEGRDHLIAVLDLPMPPPQALISSRLLRLQGFRAKALHAAGGLAIEQGDYARARVLHQESLALRRAIADKQGIAQSLNNLGVMAYEQGEYATARSLHEESLVLHRETGEKRRIARSLTNLGLVAYAVGDYSLARSLHVESLAIMRGMGDKSGTSLALANLGMVIQVQGDHALARSLHEESLEIRRNIGYKWGIASSLDSLGSLAHIQGDYSLARSLHEESLEIRLEIGDRRGVAWSLLGLGILAGDQGDHTRECLLLEESMTVSQKIGDKACIASALFHFATTNAGEPEGILRKTMLLAALAALWESISIVPAPNDQVAYERALADIRMQLEDALFEEAWSRGRTMSLAEAVNLAVHPS